MCQLAAYVGNKEAAPILLQSLRLQEGYLGGHATGMATIHGGAISMIKDNGPVDDVVRKTEISQLKGSMGIAHSRHSSDSIANRRCNRAQNAHPFLSDDGSIAMMHNGVISNHKEHWRRLETRHVFTSLVDDLNYITDSEVAIHMLYDEVKAGSSLEKALRSTANHLTGMVLLGAIVSNESDAVYLANWNQPCYLGIGDEESMFSSSRIGFSHLEEAFNVFRAPSNSFIKLTPGDVEVNRLDPARRFPDLHLDIGVFEGHVKRLLEERGELDSFGLQTLLLSKGYDEAYGFKRDRWIELVRLGYGNSNDLFEALDQLAMWGRVRRFVKLRQEAGVLVPRIMYGI